MNWAAKIVLTLIFLIPAMKAQQKYSGNAVLECNHSTDEEKPSESVLYTCNGLLPSCTAFLMFTAKVPYNTVTAIAALTSSDQAEIAKINNVTIFTIFRSGQEVIIPINCSCSDKYYEGSATYHVQAEQEITHFTIANNTYQGLSSCDSIKRANNYSGPTNLILGHDIRVPLRCACPTREQAETGTKFLLTYSIGLGDTLYALSKRFNVSVMRIREANSLSDEYTAIYPFTTILIPLPNEPLTSHTKVRGYNLTKLPFTVPVVRKSRSNRVIAIAAIVAGTLFLIILFILVPIVLFHKKRSKNAKASSSSSSQDLILEIAKFDRPLKAFKFSDIKKATGNFACKNRIKGPTSNVYRGNFRQEILAVKKNSGNSDNEVKMLYQINHFNIVKLRGFCEHEENLYLLYEYMQKGSLHEWLRRGASKDGLMNWNQVIRIALDVANGLLYLHNFANPSYMHNNISSTSILLDSNLRAKISDFSLARAANCNVATRVAKTKGYMPPECLNVGPVTTKVDVFAFGGVLLEMMTGKYPVFVQDGRERVLTAAMADTMERRNAETELRWFVWPCLAENGQIEYAVQLVKLSLSCLAQDPADRPNMVEVVSILLKMQQSMELARR